MERLAGLDQALQLAQLGLEPDGIDRLRRREEDLRMRGRVSRLAVVPELLLDLLACARADYPDLDVLLRLLPGEPDHVLRQLEDRDRLAHDVDEDPAGAAHRPRLASERDRARVLPG